MRWKFKLAVLASFAISGMAMAQTPPADQTQTTPNPPAATADQPAAAVPTEAAPRKKAEEEIVVTGSRVRRKDLTTPAPVTVISKEQLQSSGIASIGDFLQQMPEQAGATNSNVNNAGDGQTQVSLRNLGSQRTLVLVDGKRWVNGGSGAGSGSLDGVDLNSIPTPAIERVEILKDGASAVYGSDAIGGVVNIITRRRVNGVELSAYGGTSPHGDAQQYDLNVTGGAAGEKGSFMFSAGYFDQKSMLAANRGWATNAVGLDLGGYDNCPGAADLSCAAPNTIYPGGSSRIPQGRAQIYFASFKTAAGSASTLSAACQGDSTTSPPTPPDLTACATLSNPANYNQNCTTQLCQDLFTKYYGGPYSDAYNSSRCTYDSSVTGAKAPKGCAFVIDKNASTNSDGTRKVANPVSIPKINVLPDLVYNGGASFSANPTPTGVDGWRKYGSADPYNYQSVNFLITPSTRISLFSNGDFHISDFARAYFQGSFVNRQSSNLLAPEPLDTGTAGVTISATNKYNPFGETLFDARRRLVEYSGRSQGFDLDTIRAVAGIDGTLPEEFGPLQGVFWDISFNYGRTSGVTTTFGSLNTTNTGAGLGASNPDGTCAANVTGCVPVNLFHLPLGGGFVPTAGTTLTPDMVTALGGYKGINQGWNQIAAFQANLSAELFKIASERSVGIAAGYEFRGLYGGFTPNAIAQAGLDTDYNGKPTSGSYHVNEGYGELDIPLVSNIAGAEDVELQAAARVFNYSSFGTDNTYKFGGRYRPIRDVTIRGTYSTGFRAPAVTDLYGGQGPSAEAASDPCATVTPGSKLGSQCGAAGNNGDTNVQINSTVGGNTRLQPEKAKIATVGLVLEPQQVRGLSVTVDYWNVQLTQLLGFFTTQIILNGCYPAAVGSSAAPDPTMCALVTRDPNSQHISNVNDIETNVGRIITSGVDFAVRYGLPTDFGRFGFLFDSTYLIAYNETLGFGTVSQRTLHAAGNYDIGSGVAIGGLTPKIKFNAGVNYSLAGLNVGLRSRFIGSFTECANGAGDTQGLNGPGFCSDHNVDPVTGAQFPSRNVSAYVAFDVFASYLLKSPFGSTTFSAGMRNLLDASPPIVYNSFLTYADPAYDFVGRFVYGRITQNF